MRFDVYERLNGHGYLLDCQADTLSQLATRLAVPLLPRVNAPPAFPRLNPAFHIAEQEVIMVTQNAAAVPIRALGKRVTSLADHHSEIMDAIDMLLIGF